MNLLSYCYSLVGWRHLYQWNNTTHSDNDRELELLLRASEAVFIIECIVLKRVCMVD